MFLHILIKKDYKKHFPAGQIFCTPFTPFLPQITTKYLWCHILGVKKGGKQGPKILPLRNMFFIPILEQNMQKIAVAMIFPRINDFHT